ncbi:MAG: molybdate ABC transporter substrate-binding protein, partial [bacterium]
MRRALAVFGLLAILLPAAACAQQVTVFAASSLQNAFEDVARLYQQQTGRAPRLSFAASSVLARQIEQGAPAAIFAGADEQWMDYLQTRQLIVADTRRA